MNKEIHYTPLSDEQLQVAWDKNRDAINYFLANNKYKLTNIKVNQEAVLAVIVKVDQRRKYFEYFHQIKMSEYKEAALTCFWYIKFQPIGVSFSESSKWISAYDSINEKFAMYIILKTLRTMLKEKHLPTDRLDNLPAKYISELIYTFTYRDISKEALIMLVESMAVFLGLDPYAGE